jgi:hypothetical protein
MSARKQTAHSKEKEPTSQRVAVTTGVSDQTVISSRRKRRTLDPKDAPEGDATERGKPAASMRSAGKAKALTSFGKRPCGTPGCTLRDLHFGPCTGEGFYSFSPDAKRQRVERIPQPRAPSMDEISLTCVHCGRQCKSVAALHRHSAACSVRRDAVRHAKQAGRLSQGASPPAASPQAAPTNPPRAEPPAQATPQAKPQAKSQAKPRAPRPNGSRGPIAIEDCPKLGPGWLVHIFQRKTLQTSGSDVFKTYQAPDGTMFKTLKCARAVGAPGEDAPGADAPGAGTPVGAGAGDGGARPPPKASPRPAPRPATPLAKKTVGAPAREPSCSMAELLNRVPISPWVAFPDDDRRLPISKRAPLRTYGGVPPTAPEADTAVVSVTAPMGSGGERLRGAEEAPKKRGREANGVVEKKPGKTKPGAKPGPAPNRRRRRTEEEEEVAHHGSADPRASGRVRSQPERFMAGPASLRQGEKDAAAVLSAGVDTRARASGSASAKKCTATRGPHDAQIRAWIDEYLSYRHQRNKGGAGLLPGEEEPAAPTAAPEAAPFLLQFADRIGTARGSKARRMTRHSHHL